MSLRFRLAAAPIAAAVLLAVPAIGQINNQQQQQQQQSPVALAAKAIQVAQVNLHFAQAAAQKARDKIKSQLMLKPEWSPVSAELAKAETDEKNAKRAAVDGLHNKPEYQALIKQRMDADKIRQQAQVPRTPGDEDTHVTDAELDKAEDSYIKAALAMRKMEQQVFNDDQAYNDAKARVDAANAKLAQLDAEVDEALKGDPNYAPLQQAVVQAQQQVDSARQALVQARQQMAQQRKSQQPARPQPRPGGGS